jgi:ribosomal-protein-alanine N-acetyltransferase
MIRDFDIRSLTVDDLYEMQTIMLSSSRDWTSSVIASCFGAQYLQWGVFFQGALLGFVIVKKNMNDFEIMQIVIDANYQNQGLATRLLQYVVVEARRRHIRKIQLEVRRSNVTAIRVYQNCGFVEVGLRKNYYAGREDALLMDCEL